MRDALAELARIVRGLLAIEVGLEAVADRGYFKGEEILECERAGINVLVPKPQTSNNQAKGCSTNATSAISSSDDEYECPAGQRAIRRLPPWRRA